MFKILSILLMQSILSYNGDIFKLLFFEILHYVYKLKRIIVLASFPVLIDIRELVATILVNVVSHIPLLHLWFN